MGCCRKCGAQPQPQPNPYFGKLMLLVVTELNNITYNLFCVIYYFIKRSDLMSDSNGLGSIEELQESSPVKVLYLLSLAHWLGEIHRQQ